ncbi:DMT family protein [bacterium]|nr:DMT family protein [bacterium]
MANLRFVDSSLTTILLLLASNIFMTFAWSGHLKFRAAPLWVAILASWGLAFFEYCLQVPANRWGYGNFTGAELKTIQEVITLSVFVVFSIFYLKEPMTLKTVAGFSMIAGGAFLVFQK